jgi:hypothetical protein
LAASQHRRRPDRDSDIRRTSFPEQTNGTERAESWRVRCRHPDRTAGTTGLRQPPTTRNPGGPAMITLTGNGRLTSDVQLRTHELRQEHRHHLGRQRPPRPRRPAHLPGPDRLAGASQGRGRAPHQGPVRQLLRPPGAASVRDQLRRPARRARAPRHRPRVRAEAPQRRPQRPRAHTHGRQRAVRRRHPLLSRRDGRAASPAARRTRRGGLPHGRPFECSARFDSAVQTAGSGSCAGRCPSSAPLRGEHRAALPYCAWRPPDGSAESADMSGLRPGRVRRSGEGRTVPPCP